MYVMYMHIHYIHKIYNTHTLSNTHTHTQSLGLLVTDPFATAAIGSMVCLPPGICPTASVSDRLLHRLVYHPAEPQLPMRNGTRAEPEDAFPWPGTGHSRLGRLEDSSGVALTV
jgi:hypothetical protein